MLNCSEGSLRMIRYIGVVRAGLENTRHLGFDQ